MRYSAKVAFEPAVSDGDELLESLSAEREASTFTLDHMPDPHGLEQFWSGVSRDLQSDPTWFNSNDE